MTDMTNTIPISEFTTNKGYEAKIMPARCRQGKCFKVMINYEDGWRPVLSIINPGLRSQAALVDNIKNHY